MASLKVKSTINNVGKVKVMKGHETVGSKLGHAEPNENSMADYVAEAKACAKCLKNWNMIYSYRFI